MESYPFLIAKSALLVLGAVLIIEYVIRRRTLARESDQNQKKQQQLSSLTQQMVALKKDLARKGWIADQIPLFAKKMTEKLSRTSYPAIAVRSAKELFHADKVGFFTPVEGGSDLTLEIGVGFPEDWQGKVRIPSDEGILGLSLRKKTVVSRGDTQSSGGRRSSPRSFEGLGVLPDFIAPVFGISGILGVLVIQGCPYPLEGERKYVSMVADLLSTAVQNAMLIDTSRASVWVDHLTGVSNRFYFLQRFENEIRRAENYLQTLALFMFDIDKFKAVNDTHGHRAGDEVIKKVAEIVRQNIRGSDLVGRFGGDEFMVLITSTTREQAFTFADNMRERIATNDIRIPGADVPLRVTISGGLAIYPAHGQSTTELLRATDEALYISKSQGRNRVTLAPSPDGKNEFLAGQEASPAPPGTERGDAGFVLEAGEFALGSFDEGRES